MLNRWQGNTGRVQRIDESTFERKESSRNAPPMQNSDKVQSSDKVQNPGNALNTIVKRIEKIVPGVREPLDNEDIILLLILYLLYRESGDSELLIIMGAMFLL